MTPSRDLQRLIAIMAALRTPDTGCPWDLKQDFSSIAPYTIEEAYEVADAIARGDLDDLKDELGDLLLQVVFHARMAEEQGTFAFGDVVQAITEKLIRRHPHVFGDTAELTPDEVKGLWDKIKAEEKAERRQQRGREDEKGALAGIPVGMPALTRALKLQQKASKVGFDWNDPKAVLSKIREEADELEAALDDMDKKTQPRTRSATCSSRWSISRGMSTSTPTPRCAAPMRNSNAGLRRSRLLCRGMAKRLRRPRSPRWMRSGIRRRQPKENPPNAAGALRRQESRLRSVPAPERP